MSKILLNEQEMIKLYKSGKSQNEIAKIFGVSQWLISQRLRLNKVKTRNKTHKLGKRKYSINDLFFTKMNEETLWVIGWIHSDGCIIGNRIIIRLAEKDLDVLEKIKKLTKYEGKIYKSINKVKNKEHISYRLQFTSKKMVEDLKSFGIHSRKSLNEQYPNKIIEKDKQNYHRYFIRGFFEGDGSVLLEKNNSILFQIVGTKEILKSIQEIFVKYLNIKPTKLTNNIKNKNHYALRYRGSKKAIIVLDWIYCDSKLFLNRKYKKYNEIKEFIDERYRASRGTRLPSGKSH